MTENTGQQLRQAREARSISLEDAARATRIRLHYLKAFENGEWEVLPSLVQGKGFLRAYAAFLGIDPQPLIAELENEIGHGSTPAGPPAEAGPATPANRAPAAANNRSATAPESSPISTLVSRPTPQPDTRAAEAIFKEIGSKLRHQRELLGLSLEDVERHTHLRTHYLTTLEAGGLHDLPSPVQGRGMLHNYAIFLGLDPEPLLLRFAEGLQALLAARQAVEKKTTQPRAPARQAGRAAGPAPSAGLASPPAETPDSSRPAPRHLTLRRFFTLDILLGAMIVIFLAAFIVWGGLHILSLRSSSAGQTPTSTAPSIADVLSTDSAFTPTPGDSEFTGAISDTLQEPVETLPLPTAGPVLTNTLQAATPPPGSAASADAGPIQVNLVVRQRSWMRVKVDGKVEFDGIAQPGSAYPFSGDKGVEVLTGNGAAFQVVFNQTDLGVLGGYGEVVDRLYTLTGVLTPTVPVTPTPQPGSATAAANPTETATPRLTPRPSATPPPK
jgi:cytoskeletal protein RodZ